MGLMGLLVIGAAMYVPSAFSLVTCVNPSTGTVTMVNSAAECTTAGSTTTIPTGSPTTGGKVSAGEEKHAAKALADEEKKLGKGNK